MRPLLVTGARVGVYINGSRFGRAISLDYTSETPLHIIEGIDEVVPSEIAPTRCRVKGSIKLYRLAGDGGLEGMGLTAQFSDIPRQKYFAVQLRDRLTDKVLFEADYCMVEAQSWNVVTKDLMVGSFSFVGITWNNESSTTGAAGTRGLP